MTAQVIENVSDTALLVAMYRAIESERPDALIRDPLAARLAGERGRQIVAHLSRRARLGAWSVAVRTVIIDEMLTRAIDAGADTVLNLGAGLDTRPYRMKLPDTLRWIEVDYPAMIDAKEALLASEVAHCRVERIAMNLTDATARRRLFQSMNVGTRDITVLTEGVILYLTVEEVAALADDLRRLKSVRSWIVDYLSPQTLRYSKRAERHFRNTPFRFHPPDWFAFFEQHGWRPAEKRFLAEEGERLGRPAPLPTLLTALIWLRNRFRSPARREDFSKLAGYFRMEPM